MPRGVALAAKHGLVTGLAGVWVLIEIRQPHLSGAISQNSRDMTGLALHPDLPVPRQRSPMKKTAVGMAHVA